MDSVPLPTNTPPVLSHCLARPSSHSIATPSSLLFSGTGKSHLICNCKATTDLFAVLPTLLVRIMPPLATLYAPSSLLLLPTARQGMGRNRGGQSWEEPSIWGSRSRRTKLSPTMSAKAMSCVASMNITCCANQTQTERRRSFSGPTSPPSGAVKEKVKGPKLDDGGVGFPPFRFGGGGGGGGGGGSSSSGGFILFVIVLVLDYLREFERNMQNGPRRGSDYDNGLASQ